MGRARGNTTAASMPVAEADGFRLFGRRGSPQMQAQRDEAESSDVRAELMGMLAASKVSYRALSLRVAELDLRLPYNAAFYQELLAALIEHTGAYVDEQSSLISALENMGTRKQLNANTGRLLIDTLDAVIKNTTALDSQLVDAVLHAVCADESAEHPELTRLSYTLSVELLRRYRTVAKLWQKTDTRPLAEEAIAENDRSLSRIMEQAREGNKWTLDRLTPLLALTGEFIEHDWLDQRMINRIYRDCTTAKTKDHPMVKQLADSSRFRHTDSPVS